MSTRYARLRRPPYWAQAMAADHIKVIRNRPAVYLYRAAAAHVRAHVTHEAPERAARELFGDDAVTDIVLRAATTPAAISGTSGWAASLASIAIYDLVPDRSLALGGGRRHQPRLEAQHGRDRGVSRPRLRARRRCCRTVGRGRHGRVGARAQLRQRRHPAAAQAAGAHDLQP